MTVTVDVSVDWRPNPAGFAEIGHMPGMRPFTTDVANRYAAAARALTPTYTGRSRAAIRVLVPGEDRRSVFTGIRANRSFWHFIEFGTINNRPAAPFRNAAGQLGLRFADPGPGG